MVAAVCVVTLCPVNGLLEGSRDCPVSRKSYLCSWNLLTLQVAVYLTVAVSLLCENRNAFDKFQRRQRHKEFVDKHFFTSS